MYGADTYAGGDNVNNREKNFKIISTKLYVPIVTLSTKEKEQIPKGADANNLKRFLLYASFQGVNRLFVLAFDNTNNGYKKVEGDIQRKYFLPRVDITNYNALIDGRNFCDQPINDQIKKYDEIRTIATGKGDDYTTRCSLGY